MNNLIALKPALLWSYFNDICKIPRLSRHEEAIRQWLKQFSAEKKLEYREDSTGNVLIVKEADPGYENRKTVILQSHMDMVGEKNSDHPHDWMKDPIRPVMKNGWVTASGTTLGADDGIGIAAQLAILSDSTIATGKLECLFTVDEETGMTGAKYLDKKMITGRTLINLDSEDEGILFIGCAGGIDSIGRIKYTPVSVPPEMVTLKISVTGLLGGHSGDEIHKGLANAIKEMASFLNSLCQSTDFILAEFNGGNLRNGIPREAFAIIAVKPDEAYVTDIEAGKYGQFLIDKYGSIEPDISITVKAEPYQGKAMNVRERDRLLKMLCDCPHGVIAWSKDMEDLVETSTNLAIIRFIEPGLIEVVTAQRSSVEEGKKEAAELVASCLMTGGAKVTHSEGYPGWKPDINSEILNITRNSYRKLFGKDAEVRAIHAGLECGLFYGKFPGIDMISFGPTIKGAHTPEERIDIDTTSMFWELLIDVLQSIPEKQK
ncbi:MAG: aminoacyl-histidine dipeptidase [Bacteroidales bacterium]|nr:aminoacyl-histidine dipeptidase [Bacteroidales bacterium]